MLLRVNKQLIVYNLLCPLGLLAIGSNICLITCLSIVVRSVIHNIHSPQDIREQRYINTIISFIFSKAAFIPHFSLNFRRKKPYNFQARRTDEIYSASASWCRDMATTLTDGFRYETKRGDRHHNLFSIIYRRPAETHTPTRRWN